MSERYSHTQIGWVTIVLLLIGAALAVGFSIRTGEQSLLVLAFIAVAVILLFSTLTVVIDRDAVRLSFGIGLIRRRIPLAEIREVREVRSPWYYGYGIRYTPHGWLWNVWGSGGVELIYDTGGRFRIGTDEPARLAHALREALRR